MAQPVKSTSTRRFFDLSPYSAVTTDEKAYTPQFRPNIGQILRSKRVRFIAVAAAATSFFLILIYSLPQDLNLDDYLLNPFTEGPSTSPDKFPTLVPELARADRDIDWSRYAYTQYATNSQYLCNSVMLFETLHRLGSKVDRLLMYPSSMKVDAKLKNRDSRLLIKAKEKYGVKLSPIEVQHRESRNPDASATWADSYTKLLAFNQTQYDRVLSLDSDSTVLQPMDELFLMPPAPVAMPRAYWLTKKSVLSSQLMLIQPTDQEFARIMKAIETAKSGNFDMEIVNNLYGKDCMIIPHRPYNVITGEFRKTSQADHAPYLGNDYELWDPEKMLKEAKFLHFSDYPRPKPWLSALPSIVRGMQPECITDRAGEEDCRAREIWLWFYSDFQKRRTDVCETDVHKGS